MFGSYMENSWDNTPILLWAGNLSDIPEGWVLCDGNNGTPNMLNRFVKGENSRTGSGETGGQDTVNLTENQLPSHSHGGSTSNAGSHTHKVSVSEDYYSYYNDVSRGTVGSGSETEITSSVPDHSHSTSLESAGSGNSIENRPNYYEVVFIMKS